MSLQVLGIILILKNVSAGLGDKCLSGFGDNFDTEKCLSGFGG